VQDRLGRIVSATNCQVRIGEHRLSEPGSATPQLLGMIAATIRNRWLQQLAYHPECEVVL
jgi:hypothetical protein